MVWIVPVNVVCQPTVLSLLIDIPKIFDYDELIGLYCLFTRLCIKVSNC